MIGIEKMRIYPCSLSLDMADLCAARAADSNHIRKTMLIDQRSLNPAYEDPVTMAVNAADAMLTDAERASIQLLIVGTESGVDQEKPLSAWVHRFLRLPANCRTFEIKHACYGGTAALQMAAAWIASSPASGVRALVITTDQSRAHLGKPYEFVLGAGAAAVLVSDRPRLVELELGKSGYYSSEVDDLTRPTSTIETGNSETSLLSYLDAFDRSFEHYLECVGDVHLDTFFQKFVYHVPFGGITFRAHKALLRRYGVLDKQDAWAHFERTSGAALTYARRMGGTLSSSIFVALLGVIDHSPDLRPGDRVGIFSYGSGSCAEYFSVLVCPSARATAAEADLPRLLDARRGVTVDEYEAIESQRLATVDRGEFSTATDTPEGWYAERYEGRGRLIFQGTAEYFRRYAWS